MTATTPLAERTSGARVDRDVALLFASRTLRMVGYGLVATVLVLHLSALGLDEGRIGLLLTLTVAGGAGLSLVLTTRADRDGRRRTLVLGAAMMSIGGLVFVASGEFVVLVVAAVVAIFSPSPGDVGPFLPIEQAALSEVSEPRRRTTIFAWYQLVGSFAAATGSLLAGTLAGLLQAAGSSATDSYRAVLIGYVALGAAIVPIALALSPRVEVAAPDAGDRALPGRRLGLHRSRRVVAELAALFSLDSFGSGFVVQAIVALWLHVRWEIDPAALGGVFFVANLLAGVSGLVAARLAARFGLVPTMVWTHIPSNLMLAAIPFMPSAALAVALLLVRASISQMDVPTRQSYTMAVVDPDERSAAAGVTGIARSAGAAVSPSLALPLIAAPVLGGGLPFVLAGGLKLAYDLALWRRFRAVRPPEEVGRAPSAA